jgi:hypothetical protein
MKKSWHTFIHLVGFYWAANNKDEEHQEIMDWRAWRQHNPEIMPIRIE